MPSKDDLRKYGKLLATRVSATFSTVREIDYLYKGKQYRIYEVENGDNCIVKLNDNPFNVQFGGF